MNRLPEIELMRLLHGELPPERAFELHERLAREPELAEELRRLEATWDRLELPPASPVPRGFARAVAARAESGGLWSAAPTRIRAAGFALLAAGLALGVGIASVLARLDAGTGNPAGAPGAIVASSPTVPIAAAPGSSSPTVTAVEPGASSKGPAPVAPATRTPSAAPTVPTPSTPETPISDTVAELDYDLPAEDGAYADEGTLADDFWQAFDGSDTGAAADPDTGSGSEGL